jgi:hypothetical protein
MAACPNAGRCHGWSCVCCAACGVVAPCAREDCPSCGEHPEILQEATERRTRKVQWVAEGADIRLPALPAKEV